MKVAIGFINNAGSAFVYSNALLKAGCFVKCFFLQEESFQHVQPFENEISYSYYSNIRDIVTELITYKYDILINLASTGGTYTILQDAYERLRAHNIRIATVHLGSDSRLSPISTTIYYIKHLYGSAFDKYPLAMAEDISLRSSFVALAERYSDVIIDNPFSWHLHRKPYINWHYMGKPCDCYSSFSTTLYNYELKSKIHSTGFTDIRIVHIPSNQRTKGTRYIDSVLQRISQLRGSGIGIRYFRPSCRLSHAQVIDLLDNADILIDQVYSDLPISAIAAEALGRGVYVIELGKYLAFPQAWAPSKTTYPTFIGDSEDLETILDSLIHHIRLVRNTDYLHSLHSWNSFYSSEQIGYRLSELLFQTQNLSYPNHYSKWIVDPSCAHHTEVSFHPQEVFTRLSRIGFYDIPISRLETLGYLRAASALSGLVQRLSNK